MISQLWRGLIVFVGGIGWVQAATLQADILDAQGQGVPEAVLALTPQQPVAVQAQEPAVIAQRGRTFVPLVTAVQQGNSVRFPNEDTTRHHVYSISKAQRFEIPLYAKQEPSPVKFDTPGVITLGCNIHDHMLAYLFVLATPYFAKTDAAGHVTLPTLPGGDYTVQVWHPGIKDYLQSLEPLHLNADETRSAQYSVKLRPAQLWQPKPEPESQPGSDSYYPE
jgi:plastocyanin